MAVNLGVGGGGGEQRSGRLNGIECSSSGTHTRKGQYAATAHARKVQSIKSTSKVVATLSMASACAHVKGHK